MASAVPTFSGALHTAPLASVDTGRAAPGENHAAIERFTNRMAMTSASCHADRLVNDRQHQEDIVANEMFERGLEIRKSVLGKEFVEKSISSADDFNRPMQELVTEYCWGAIWGREGLSKKTRSMLNLAMLCALNRPHELRMHLAGALRNGVTREEIREVLLQVAIYCGVPAGVDAFRNAREVFAEIDGAKAKS